jgi:hypothetical protein
VAGPSSISADDGPLEFDDGPLPWMDNASPFSIVPVQQLEDSGVPPPSTSNSDSGDQAVDGSCSDADPEKVTNDFKAMVCKPLPMPVA